MAFLSYSPTPADRTSMISSVAMILAAGFGKRLKPLAGSLPKPLVLLQKKTTIDHIFDTLEKINHIKTCVVNIRHLAPKLQDYLKKRTHPSIIFSYEKTILETGGGIQKVLPFFNQQLFLCINGDIWWEDDTVLQNLIDFYGPHYMDVLLLLSSKENAIGFEETGDYHTSDDHKLMCRKPAFQAPYIYSGIQTIHPHLFKNVHVTTYSILTLHLKAQEEGRLFGLIHKGLWCNIGTYRSLNKLQNYLETVC